jgi:biotin carboxyl carrier protein
LTFVVEVASRTRTIDVRRSGDRWQVTVDGRPVEVDLAMAGGRLSLLIDQRSYEVAVERRTAADVLVHVNGREVPVALGRRGSAAAPAGAAAGLAAGPAAITAPMPGRVVKLLVKAGDPVAVRQGVIVVEAMKMENELRAPRAGTVRELRVAEGALVEAGATLAVIE